MSLIEIDVLPDQQRELKKLQALSEDLQKKGVRSALNASATPFVLAMRAAAPDDPTTGGSRLAKAVNKSQAKTGAKVRTGSGRQFVKLDPGELGLIVGPNKKVGGKSAAGLASKTEWGTKPHKIRAKRRFLWIGNQFAGSSVQHPGVKAMHWMSGAFDAAEPLAESAFYRGLEKWLSKNGH